MQNALRKVPEHFFARCKAGSASLAIPLAVLFKNLPLLRVVLRAPVIAHQRVVEGAAAIGFHGMASLFFAVHQIVIEIFLGVCFGWVAFCLRIGYTVIRSIALLDVLDVLLGNTFRCIIEIYRCASFFTKNILVLLWNDTNWGFDHLLAFKILVSNKSFNVICRINVVESIHNTERLFLSLSHFYFCVILCDIWYRLYITRCYSICAFNSYAVSVSNVANIVIPNPVPISRRIESL